MVGSIIAGLAILTGIAITFGGMVIIGLPMLVIGVIILISMFSKGKQEPDILQGNCPYCAQLMNVLSNRVGAKCPACAKQFVIRGMKFICVD